MTLVFESADPTASHRWRKTEIHLCGFNSLIPDCTPNGLHFSKNHVNSGEQINKWFIRLRMTACFDLHDFPCSRLWSHESANWHAQTQTFPNRWRMAPGSRLIYGGIFSVSCIHIYQPFLFGTFCSTERHAGKCKVCAETSRIRHIHTCMSSTKLQKQEESHRLVRRLEVLQVYPKINCQFHNWKWLNIVIHTEVIYFNDRKPLFAWIFLVSQDMKIKREYSNPTCVNLQKSNYRPPPCFRLAVTV